MPQFLTPPPATGRGPLLQRFAAMTKQPPGNQMLLLGRSSGSSPMLLHDYPANFDFEVKYLPQEL